MIIDKDTKPGMYRTTKPHVLKKPDKRLRAGWNSTTGVEAGEWILVTVEPERRFSDDDVQLEPRWLEVTLHLPASYDLPDKVRWSVPMPGNVSTRTVGKFDEDKDARAMLDGLVADLVPVRTGEAILDWIAPDEINDRVARNLLATLVHGGRLSEADIREAMQVREARYEREHDIECFVAGWQFWVSDPGAHSFAKVGEHVRHQKGGGDDTKKAAEAGWTAAHGAFYPLTDAKRAALPSDEEIEKLGAEWADEHAPRKTTMETKGVSYVEGERRMKEENDRLRAELAEAKREAKKYLDTIGQAIAVLQEPEETDDGTLRAEQPS